MSQSDGAQDGPRGLGGWLILPAIGLVLSPLRMGFQFFTDLWPVFDSEIWRQLNDASRPGHRPMLPTLIMGETVANVVMFAFTLVLIWFFFRKSRYAPRLFIVWLALLLVVQVVDTALISSLGIRVDGESMRDVVRSLVAAAIWIPYFLVSKRVKNTFVEPRHDVARHF
ncbi:MAG: DUF2569 domain-containing protein [Alphaproteobacteria bacterium]|nr:DUF2569 domain-containing protein [Alphaproteobacteria bacterium]